MEKLLILILLLFHFLDSTGQTKADTLYFENQAQNLKDSLLKTLAKENYAIERNDSGSYHFENYRLNSKVIVQFTIQNCYSIDQSIFPNYSELMHSQDYRNYLKSNKCDSTITLFSKNGKILYSELWSFRTFEADDVPEQGLSITGRDNKAILHYRIRYIYDNEGNLIGENYSVGENKYFFKKIYQTRNKIPTSYDEIAEFQPISISIADFWK